MRVFLSIASVFLLSLGGAGPTSAGTGIPAHCDYDGVPDAVDNCMCVNNHDQCDTDQDGDGNACDPDINNDGVVGGPDYGPVTASFGKPGHPTNPADVNCDGVVGGPDYGPITANFGGAPGISGLSCAGTIPCP